MFEDCKAWIKTPDGESRAEALMFGVWFGFFACLLLFVLRIVHV